MDQLQIRSSEGPGGISILELEGPLTLTTLFDFQDTVRAKQAAGLILDLGGVPYMDSAGLGAVLGAYAFCQRRGNKFALANVARRVVTLLEVTKVDGVLPRFDTLDAAEAALSATSLPPAPKQR
jgi:anti-sigma B factor antagonist